MEVMANPSPAPAPRKYTVQPGDTLSKVSERYYSYPERYMKIFKPTAISWTTLTSSGPAWYW
jgi:nucleoid-associated protein YgaU